MDRCVGCWLFVWYWCRDLGAAGSMDDGVNLMNFLGVFLNMIAIVLIGDYGLFDDGAGVHEDSALYDLVWQIREMLG